VFILKTEYKKKPRIECADVQKEIVARIEEEQALVASNKRLIEIFEGKIQSRIGEVWNR